MTRPVRPVRPARPIADAAPLKAVVTGGGSGFGLELARALARRGHRVVVTVRRPPPPELRLPQALAEGGARRDGGDPPPIAWLICDARDGEATREAAARAHAHLRGVTVWVNNAASTVDPLAGDLGLRSADSRGWREEVRACCETNLLGAIWGTSAAAGVMGLPRDREGGGGHIFNVEGSGSTGGPSFGHAVYGATKAAASRFSQAADRSCAESPAHGLVRVHRLTPGMMRTPLLRRHVDALEAQAGGGGSRVAALLWTLALEPREAAEEAASVIEAVARGRRAGGHVRCYVPPLLRRALAGAARFFSNLLY